MQSSDVKYAYLRHMTPYGYQQFGGAVVAYCFDDDTRRLYMALAVCHPKDRFVRQNGRALAHSRLMKFMAECQAGTATVDDQHYFFNYADILPVLKMNHQDVVHSPIFSGALRDRLDLHDFSNRALEGFIRDMVDMGD